MGKWTTYILAGGLGSRLAPKLPLAPKALAPVAGRPFLDWQLVWLKQQGLTEIVLLVGYLKEPIKDRYKDGKDFGVSIRYSVEEELLGTGGAFLQALHQFPSENFILLNGDTFFQINLEWWLAQTSLKNRVAMGLKYKELTDRYGRVEINEQYQVTKYVEKKTGMEGYINGGIYAGSTQAFASIPIKKCSMEQDIIPALVKKSWLHAIPFAESFMDIGLPEDYERAQTLIPAWESQLKQPALFLDRDGIIVKDKGHNNIFDESDFYPDTLSFLKRHKKFQIIVISNQSAIAKGLASIAEVDQANDYIKDRLEANGVRVKAMYYCPFHEEGSVIKYRKKSLLRKPNPGMILKAAEEHGIDLYDSLMIGDQDSDVIRLPYLKTILIQRGNHIINKALITPFDQIFP